MTVAICGNHQEVFCTESELAWTFEHLGHRVLRLQEDLVTTEHILSQCLANQASLFVYVHTHGWQTLGAMSFDTLLQRLRENGIKSASFHLDRYWGLDQLDKRESMVGQHPFWHTDVVFTADGGHQDDFTCRGVNHYWLPPAVAERHCYRGTPSAAFTHDVIFVGSRYYHPEYQFRERLLQWLQATYGSRFHHYGTDRVIRERELNDLYASAKVIVGDSCFAGAPFYWSDRVPETLGRGGFLIHPATEGLSIPGLVTFQPGELVELADKIDYYLHRDDERASMSDLSFAHVRQHDTYTQRMETIMRVTGAA